MDRPKGFEKMPKGNAQHPVKPASRPAGLSFQESRQAMRMYQSAKSNRLTAGWSPSTTSADSELVQSLQALRARCRQLVRDGSYAKRARTVVVNNVVGTGIGLQAQVKGKTGKILKNGVNDEIEDAWGEWGSADSCHTGGRLSFMALERQVIGQVFEAGDCFIRMHPTAFGDSRIPFALELIESERLAEEYTAPYLTAENGNELRMGIEIDSKFHRPVAYYFRTRHPGEIRFAGTGPDEVERVPADQVIHVAIIDRWPQTRGEPWMHAVARRLNDMDGYAEAEIVRARSQAAYPGVIETPAGATAFGEKQSDGSVVMEVEPGVFKRLFPGEKMNFGSPTAPNSAMDGFMRYMLREIAAGVGPSYESLSRDYSQSNYSSTRIALLDDRDLWRFLQAWFIDSFRKRIHKNWLRQAVLARALSRISLDDYALDMRRFENVRYKPRGWTWIDPTKEVEAFIKAVKGGFNTVDDVISKTGDGMDLEEVLDQREKELELMREKGLVFETSPEMYANTRQQQTPPSTAPNQEEETDDARPGRVVSLP